MKRKRTITIISLASVTLAMIIGAIVAVRSTGAWVSEKTHFTQKELIRDTEQLVETIERTHPDPYTRGGGKIAFHRNYQEVLDSIPEEGLGRDEFARLLRPFVASIHDGHTVLENAYSTDKLYPGGVPLLFDVVEQSLYVAGVAGRENRALIGSRLLSVEGVPLADLIERQKQWQGVENTYHALYLLSAQSLLYEPYLKDLLPEWQNPHRVRVELQSPAGEIKEFEFDLPVDADTLFIPESQVNLPKSDESGFLYGFLDQERQIAYLRIDHMNGYREMYERRGDSDAETYPSATELFRELLAEMKESGTKTLIVDLRDCVGGNSAMSDILFYFLYGKDTLQEVKGSAYAAGGGSVFKRPPSTKKRAYDFSWDFTDDADRFQSLLPQVPAHLEEYAKAMPTFYAEYRTGTYEGHYLPEQVMVLVSPKTFSSGFILARYFYLSNATLIGTPSGQAITWFCDPIHLSLKNTGIKVVVSTTYCSHLLPDEPEMVDVLPVHIPLTYEELASYEFDRNSEVLYALNLASD